MDFRPQSAIPTLSLSSVHSKSNPFYIKDRADLFCRRDEEIQRRQTERNTISRLSLVERTDLLVPPVPPVHTQRSKSVSAVSAKSEKRSSSVTTTGRKSKRTTEFISDKREIYLTQLLIDKKKEQINKINKQIDSQNNHLADWQYKINETMQKIKTSTHKIEEKLVQGRRSAESALTERVEIAKKFRMQEANTLFLKNEVQRNIEYVEMYQKYYDFMKIIVPLGKKPEDFYNDTNMVYDQFAVIERENIFLLEQCQRLEENIKNGVDVIKNQSIDTDRIASIIDAQLARLERIETVPNEMSSADAEKLKETENEISRLSRLVKKTYMKCFKEKTDFTPIVMLTRIENELEKLYRQINEVSPQFVHELQTKINKVRREEDRRAAQEEKDRILNEKKEAALKRATKPAKRRTGRPLFQRTVPYTKNHNDDKRQAELMRKKVELKYLLYGPALE